MTARRALVTGAAGFLGTHLLKRLDSPGWQATGIGRQVTSPNTLACDITDASRVAEVVSQTLPDVIFHAAALMPAAASSATADDFLRVNVGGTLNLLEAVRNFVPHARVMLVTSSAMYGIAEAADGVIHEESTLRPVNSYGMSKATQHLIGYQFYAQYKLDVVRVCPFNLIGYGLPKGLVASDFAAQIVAIERGQQEAIIRVGDLSGKRDFLDVQDAVSALVSLVEAGRAGESYNLASAQAVPIIELLHDMLSMSKAAIEVQPRPNIVKNAVPIQIGAHDKLTALTGWTPQIALKQSLSDVLAYWRTVKIKENA
ncbi:MAG: NAD-dependent epimerase/dehydratase family protein [Anaerolineae bacterium]|nr:NAD-dependent epimerase/dehydratase family protein [Anaerolineae bacterium]